MIATPSWLTSGKLNIINLVAYIINVTVTYLSLTGIFGATNTELSLKYQTLVTPAGWAFSIWGPIFIWEGIFALGQFLPSVRASAVIPAISLWWSAVCTFQVAWSIAFAQDLVGLSLGFMLAILVSLGMMVFRIYKAEEGTISEFLLLKGPFFLQLGWIIAASFVNLSVVFDAAIPSLIGGSGIIQANGTVTGGDGTLNPAYFRDGNAATLLTVAVLSLAGLFLTGVLVGVLPERTDGNAIICGVVAWALGGVAAQLRDPVPKNALMFSPVTITALSNAAAVLSVAMTLLVVVLAGRRIVQDRCGLRNCGGASEADHVRRNSQRDLSQKLEEGASPVMH